MSWIIKVQLKPAHASIIKDTTVTGVIINGIARPPGTCMLRL